MNDPNSISHTLAVAYAMTTYYEICIDICKISGSSRTRIADEIIPISAEHSRTYRGEEKYAAEKGNRPGL